MKKYFIILSVYFTACGLLYCTKIPDGNITVSIAEEKATQPMTKEEQEEQKITTDTGQETMDPPVSRARKSGISTSAEKSFIKAQELYRRGVLAYLEGNKAKAEKRFTEALEKLDNLALSADAGFYLKDQFDKLFLKANTLFANEESTSTSRAYKIPIDTENAVTKSYIERYTQGESKQRIKRALERSGRYRDMIFATLKKYNLPRELIFLPVVESLYEVNDLSKAGALGLWQFMPQSARAFGLKVNYWIDERKDPERSTEAAARYLRDLYILFDDWHLALAAYNRGEFGLGRDMHFSRAVNISQFKDRKAVPQETENYVPAVYGGNTDRR